MIGLQITVRLRILTTVQIASRNPHMKAVAFSYARPFRRSIGLGMGFAILAGCDHAQEPSGILEMSRPGPYDRDRRHGIDGRRSGRP